MTITAASVTPDPVDVVVDTIATDASKPKDLLPNTPTPVGMSAAMTPTAAAGVLLAKFVLWMTVGSIGALILYLAVMDILVASNVDQAYQRVYSGGAVGAELKTLKQIDSFSTALATAQSNRTYQFDADTIKNGEDIVAAINQLPSVPASARTTIAGCVPPPNTDSRNDITARCIVILNELKDGIIAQSSSVAHAQAAADAVGKIGEQRQGLHTFWVQAAQLILLNLLLPLLTALFGYVFGTQQVSQR